MFTEALYVFNVEADGEATAVDEAEPDYPNTEETFVSNPQSKSNSELV